MRRTEFVFAEAPLISEFLIGGKARSYAFIAGMTEVIHGYAWLQETLVDAARGRRYCFFTRILPLMDWSSTEDEPELEVPAKERPWIGGFT